MGGEFYEVGGFTSWWGQEVFYFKTELLTCQDCGREHVRNGDLVLVLGAFTLKGRFYVRGEVAACH